MFPRELPASNLTENKRGLGEKREGFGLREVEFGNLGLRRRERDGVGGIGRSLWWWGREEEGSEKRKVEEEQAIFSMAVHLLVCLFLEKMKIESEFLRGEREGNLEGSVLLSGGFVQVVEGGGEW